MTNDDITLQGDSLCEYLSTYFVDPHMQLLEDSYWTNAGYPSAGFEMHLKARHCHALATVHAGCYGLVAATTAFAAYHQ